MLGHFSGLLRPIKHFARSKDGSITVEAVVWIPIYILFIAIIVDTSLLFHGKAKAMRMAHDGNRQASVGLLETEKQVEDAVFARVKRFSPSAKVDTVFGANTVQTTLTIPANELTAIGSFSSLLKFDLTVSSVHLMES